MRSVTVILGHRQSGWAHALLEPFTLLSELQSTVLRVKVIEWNEPHHDMRQARSNLVHAVLDNEWPLHFVIRANIGKATDDLLEVLTEFAKVGMDVEIVYVSSERIAA